jgi:hypothetical protein
MRYGWFTRVSRRPPMAVAPVRVRVIEEIAPFGDMPLAPAYATGRSEAELAREIAEVPFESAAEPGERVPPLTGRLGVGAAVRGNSQRERKRAA